VTAAVARVAAEMAAGVGACGTSRTAHDGGWPPKRADAASGSEEGHPHQVVVVQRRKAAAMAVAASALLWVGTAAVTAAAVTATAVVGRVGAAAVVAVAVTVANPGRRRARVRDAAGIGVSERAWLLEQLLLKDTVSYGASTEPNIQKLPTHFEHTNWK